jgi:hypothetical protein
MPLPSAGTPVPETTPPAPPPAPPLLVGHRVPDSMPRPSICPTMLTVPVEVMTMGRLPESLNPALSGRVRLPKENTPSPSCTRKPMSEITW